MSIIYYISLPFPFAHNWLSRVSIDIQEIFTGVMGKMQLI